jgi:hypothetical protein
MQQIKPDKSRTASPSESSIEPLVGTEVNLESFPWAPVRLAFLSSHPLALAQNPEPFRALVLMIANAWHKLPAMTAPNDDVQLAAMAGFGRDVEAWLAVRDSVMQGWALCSDGRWHHPELASWALQSWEAKMSDERFRAKQSARARSRKSGVAEHPDASSISGHGLSTAQPYKKEPEADRTRYDKDLREGDSMPDSGTDSSLTDGLASIQVIESGAQEDSKAVDEDKDVLRIFEHWQVRTGRHGEKLTHSRLGIIRARLREGITPAQICRAIDHAAEDDFYQGRTGKQTQRIDTLDVICKDSDRILRLASAGDAQKHAGHPKPAVRSTARSFSTLLDRCEPEVIDAECAPARGLQGDTQ